MKKILLATIATCCMATTMHAQDNWTMKVTMKSGEVKEYPCNDVKDVTFSNSDNSYYADVAATNTYNLYYGAVSEQLAAYTLHLCDGKLSKGGLPTEINKHDIRLTVLAKPSQNPAGAALPGGTYKLVNSTEKAGVYGKQSVYIETNKVNADGQVDGFLDSLATCNLNVERRADGTYKLLVEGELRDHGKVRFAYDGKLEFVNKDPAAGYQTITEDVNFVPRTMSGRYVKATDTYCDYTITFLNCDTDDEGFIFIVDRKKDLIISKGINIYPREIEEALLKLEAIEAAAVIGVKDRYADEEIVAFIQFKEDMRIDEKEIRDHLKKHLANFKMPKYIHIEKELPRNATGKVLKRALKARIKEKA